MVQKHKNLLNQQNQELIQVQTLAVRVMEKKVETTMVEIAMMTVEIMEIAEAIPAEKNQIAVTRYFKKQFIFYFLNYFFI